MRGWYLTSFCGPTDLRRLHRGLLFGLIGHGLRWLHFRYLPGRHRLNGLHRLRRWDLLAWQRKYLHELRRRQVPVSARLDRLCGLQHRDGANDCRRDLVIVLHQLPRGKLFRGRRRRLHELRLRHLPTGHDSEQLRHLPGRLLFRRFGHLLHQLPRGHFLFGRRLKRLHHLQHGHLLGRGRERLQLLFLRSFPRRHKRDCLRFVCRRDRPREHRGFELLGVRRGNLRGGGGDGLLRLPGGPVPGRSERLRMRRVPHRYRVGLA